MITATRLFFWGVYILFLYYAVFWVLVLINRIGSYKEDKILKNNTKNSNLKNEPVTTIAVPVFNEEKTITRCLKSLARLNYPNNKYRVVVIDDGSVDSSLKKILRFKEQHPKLNLKVVINKRNKGKAVSLNKVLSITDTELFACLDADSFIDKNALREAVKLFDKDTAAVTPNITIYKPKTLLQQVQWLEWKLMMLGTKLLSNLKAQFVTPGPFSVYKTKVLKRLRFDEKNLVEDQEIALRIQKLGYKIKYNPYVKSYTTPERNLKYLYKQRNRWGKGTIMNLVKHNDMILNPKYGDLGMMQMVFNGLFFFFGFAALISLWYYILKPITDQLRHLYLIGFDIPTYIKSFKFKFELLSIDLQTLLFGIVLLTYIIFFITMSLLHSKARFRKHDIFTTAFYIIVYYIIIGAIQVMALFEYLIGRVQKW